MNDLFYFLLDFNRFYMDTIRIIIFVIFIILALILTFKYKKSFIYNLIVIILLIIILVADYYGSEGSIMCFLDCLTNSINSFFLLFLTIIYSLLLLSGIVISFVSMFIKDNIRKLLILINFLISTFLIYLACLFNNDILYLMNEMYETSDVSYVVFPILLKYCFIPIVGIFVFIVLIIIFKRKKTK